MKKARGGKSHATVPLTDTEPEMPKCHWGIAVRKKDKEE
jgi:hypothetical protein